MAKKIEVFRDMEDSDSYFVYGTEDAGTARVYLEIEYPETKNIFSLINAKEVRMSKCLDCGSWWTGDNTCGECGEFRLSRRGRYYWQFSKLN